MYYYDYVEQSKAQSALAQPEVLASHLGNAAAAIVNGTIAYAVNGTLVESAPLRGIVDTEL